MVVEAIDLNAQVREIGDIVRSSVDRRAELVLELEPGIPGIDADVAQIQQVVPHTPEKLAAKIAQVLRQKRN